MQQTRFAKLAIRSAGVALLALGFLAPGASVGARSDRADGADSTHPGLSRAEREARADGETPSEARAYSQRFMADAEKFVELHTPNRYKLYQQKVASNSAAAAGLYRAALAKRYFELVVLKRQDPDLYDVRVKQMEKSDEIVGLRARLAHAIANPTGAEKPDAVRQQLRDAIRANLDLRKQEHEHRIAKLKALLADQQTKLDQLNRLDPDKFVERRLRQLESSPVGADEEDSTTRPTTGETQPAQ